MPQHTCLFHTSIQTTTAGDTKIESILHRLRHWSLLDGLVVVKMCSYKVWADIDELAFHENAILLEACARSQAVQSHGNKNAPRMNDSDLPWARDFLDDFALIAAGPGEASNVTAACLELSQDVGDSIIVRVAKNEDFDSQGRQRLSRIVEVMNEMIKKDLSISEGESICFDLIVNDCHPRILKQIAGPQGLWSLVHQSGMASMGLPPKVKHSHRARHSESNADIEKIGKYSSRTHEEFLQLAASRWTRMVQFIDHLKTSPDLEAIKCLARLAYDVRRSDSFRILLESLCRQQRHHTLKIVERLGKVAKFFRSAVTLAQVAASATPKFKCVKLETVRSISRSIGILRSHTVADMEKRAPARSEKLTCHAGEIQRLLRRWRKYIVHAEMLLLLFYEEHPEITLATNYIGISKRSCYLCANFIRIHNVFAVEGQHQQLYCLWTLPEEIKFKTQTRSAIFSRAVTDLQRLLESRATMVSLPSYRSLTFLKESVANFSRATFIARAYSLEKLKKINEAEECMNPSMSIPPLVGDNTDFEKTLEGPEEIGKVTWHEEVKQDGIAADLSSPPADVTAKDSSCVKETILQTAQIPSLNIDSTQSSQDLGRGCPQTKNPLPRPRRRKHPRAKLEGIDRSTGQRKVSGSAMPRQHHHSSRVRRVAGVRSPKIKGVVHRDPVSARRHSKKVSHQKSEHVTVGCSSLFVSCLKSLGSFMLIAFGKRY